MPWINTHEWQPGQHNDFVTEQIYNGLDVMVTLEVNQALDTLYNRPPEVYDFARALQAPALDMMLRGFRIDHYERQKGIDQMRAERLQLESVLDRLAHAVWDRPLNANSPKQLLEFFYNALRLPQQWTSKKGERKLSTDRESLEKLQQFFHAMPIVATILAIRERVKMLSVLTTEIDADGRMRTSYNVAGTETGRWSSSSNAWGTGTNLQNITGSLRKMFIADPGYKLVGIDLEQAESREVGWLCGILFSDWQYYDACISGDLHTTVCRLTWPSLRARQDLLDDSGTVICPSGQSWTSDNKANRAIAEQSFYRHLTYRDMAKKLGHGSNYYGKPFTMARHAKIPVSIAEDFQASYFGAFPGIPKWHKYVAEQLQRFGFITTIFGRKRHFFGRPGDDTTLREAIAYAPQSSTGDRLNLALWRIWRYMGMDPTYGVQLIGQVHDAVYFQFPEDHDEHTIVAKALSLIDTPFVHNDRVMTVPGEAKTGWNWGNYDPKTNPDGLRKLKLGKPDGRTRSTWMDRVL